MNMRNLERVLAREEEVKKKAIVHKDVYKGPQVRYLSKDGKLSVFSHLIIASFHKRCKSIKRCLRAGCNYIEFCNGASFSSEISTKTLPCK